MKIKEWMTSIIRRPAGAVARKAYSLAELAERFASARDETDIDEDVDTSQPFAQCVWVYAAISLIARSISRIPFLIRDGKPTGDIVESGRLHDIAEKPNRWHNGRQFIEYVMVLILLDGHMFWETINPTVHNFEELMAWPYNAFRPDVFQDEFGEDYAAIWRRRNTNEPLLPNMEIFGWKLPNPYSRIYGLSPLAAGNLSVYGNVAAGQFNKSFFVNGGYPGMVFSTDAEGFDQTAADEAARIWTEKHGGALRSHKPAFLGHGLKPQLVGFAPKDMDYGTLKQLSKSEILAIYNIPESLLGAMKPQAGVTIGGAERRPDEENFYLNTVIPWAEQFAGIFNDIVSKRFSLTQKGYFNYKTVPILQDRDLDRAKEGREWIQAGATLNEINRKFELGFTDHEWGDEYWVPSNMVPARLNMDGPVSFNTETVKEPDKARS